MSTGNLRQAGNVNPTSAKKAGYPPDKWSHFSLSREMWQPVLIRVQKRYCSVVKENVNFFLMGKHILKLTCLLGGGSRQLSQMILQWNHSLRHTSNGLWQAKNLLRAQRARWHSSFFLPSPVPEERQQRLHSCLSWSFCHEYRLAPLYKPLTHIGDDFIVNFAINL